MPTPLVLESSVVTEIDPPVDPTVEVVALPIVAVAIPTPTLVDGRAQ